MIAAPSRVFSGACAAPRNVTMMAAWPAGGPAWPFGGPAWAFDGSHCRRAGRAVLGPYGDTVFRVRYPGFGIPGTTYRMRRTDGVRDTACRTGDVMRRGYRTSTFAIHTGS
jgi:hypothetical protein